MPIPAQAQFGPDCTETPAWLNQRPADTTAFIGISSIEKRAGNDIRKKANDQALNALAQEIFARVKSTSNLNETEDDRGFQSTFVNNVEVFSQANISGHQTMVWECDNQYSVYLRLPKKTYRTQINDVKNRAANAYTASRKALEAGDVLTSLQLTISAWTLIEPYAYERMSIRFKGQTRELVSLLEQEIRALLTGIHIEPENNEYSGKTGRSIVDPVQVEVFYLKGNQAIPVKNAPLHFLLLEAPEDLDTTVQSNASGIARAFIRKISSSRQHQQIQVALDLTAVIGDFSASKKQQVASHFTTTPQATIDLSTTRNALYVSTSHQDQLCTKFFFPALKNEMQQEQLFVETPETADLEISCSASLADAVPSNAVRVTAFYFDIDISVRDLNTNEQLFSTQRRGIKSVSVNQQDAERKAFVGPRGVVPELVTETTDAFSSILSLQ